jgi:hypothetical protein
MWRMTRYGILLWGYPPHEAETILPNVIGAVDELSGQTLGWHLENQPDGPAPLSADQWVALAKQQRDQEDHALVLVLDSSSGLSISLTLGFPQHVRNFDVLSIDFGIEHLVGRTTMFNYEKLYSLFVELISLFEPFWARITDEELITADGFGKIHLSVDVTKVPATIHWFNYFDDEIADRLGGREKLRSAPVYQVKEWENPPGIILVLQREPFDFHNQEHRQRHAEVTRYLDLDRLQSLYPKRREIDLELRRSNWRQMVIERHGGLGDATCLWHGCNNKVLRGMAFCPDHVYPQFADKNAAI